MLYLNCAEHLEAYFDARHTFANHMTEVDAMAVEVFNYEHSYQLVHRMLIDPRTKNPKHRITRSAQQVRELLSMNEIEFFMSMHKRQQDEEARDWGMPDEPSLALGQIALMLGLSDDAPADEVVAAAKGAFAVLRDA